MGPYNNILIGVDGSDASLHAFTEGLRLAGKGVRVVAVSVAPEYNGDLRLVGVQDVKKLLTQPCATALTRCQEEAAAAGVTIKTVCAMGQPDARLVELADDENSDLIVIGAKGLTSMMYSLLGSVARKVIGFTTRDVMVMPADGRIGWNTILLATDLSPHSKGAEDRALELALAHQAKLHLVTTMELPSCLFGEAGELGCSLPADRSQPLEDLQAQAASYGIAAELHLKQGDPFAAILATAQQLPADLIVMGAHGRTGLTRLLMGSITEKVIGHAPCPVLVVKV